MSYFEYVLSLKWNQYIYILEPLAWFVFVWFIYKVARALVTSVKIDDKKKNYNSYATYSIYLMAIVASFFIAGILAHYTLKLYFLRLLVTTLVASTYGIYAGFKTSKI